MEQAQNTNATPEAKTDAVMGCSRTSLVVGGILIAAIAIVGLVYLAGKDDAMMGRGMMMETMAPAPGTPEEIAASEAATAKAAAELSAQGTSDELGSIEADLNATDLGVLGDPSQL